MTIGIAKEIVVIENVTAKEIEKGVTLNVSVNVTDVKNEVNLLTELRDTNSKFQCYT